jgi:cytochrome c oxidase subunit 2
MEIQKMIRSLLLLIISLFPMSVYAQNSNIVGQPIEKGVNFQEPVTELARDIVLLDNFLLYVITFIVLFVVALLVYVMIRFHHKNNPEPSTFTHYSPVEIAWTIIPILILLVIGSMSIPILFKQQQIPDADITIKVTGYQWYWGYEYPDEKIAFDSFMLEKEELEEFGYSQKEYLLATNTKIVVPKGKVVEMQVTSADVIHSWAMPAFGVKQDGVPGRLASLWFEAEKEGIYFGQCSELCGERHAYMPITVEVVSEEEYNDWILKAKEEYPL